jgi:hypothetical protein
MLLRELTYGLEWKLPQRILAADPMTQIHLSFDEVMTFINMDDNYRIQAICAVMAELADAADSKPAA